MLFKSSHECEIPSNQAFLCLFATLFIALNPFNAICSKLLLLKGYSTILVKPTFLIFDIRVLWHSIPNVKNLKCWVRPVRQSVKS